MICLDTNYLILALVSESRESQQIIDWSRDGERFCTSSIAWYEFTCGPADSQQIAAVRALLDQIIAFDDHLAEAAADLFNAAGRRRHLRVDGMIAATALSAKAVLATNDRNDFSAFSTAGLQLVD